MPTYTSPGVYIQETQLSSLTSSAGGQAAAAFWGTASRGPVTATPITDWNTYKSLFGDLQDAYDLGYAVYHYFANGGRVAYVTRVAAADAVSAETATPVQWYPLATGSAGAAADMMTLTANSPGVWGNGLTTTITAGDVIASVNNFPTFNLTVRLNGKEVERWVELSVDPDDNRYVEAVVNSYSSFITVSDVNPDNNPYEADAELDLAGATFTLGADGTIVPDTAFPAAFGSIDTVKGNLILNAVGQVSTTITTAILAKAATRGDSFAILDPLKTDVTLAQTQATAANFVTGGNAGYGAAYAPALRMVDPGKTGVGAVRTTFPGGALAGLYVRTDTQRSVAKTPAGDLSDIRGAISTVYKLTNTQVGTLYTGTPAVNTFKVVAGAGVNVSGGRTLNKLNPDKYINVRRTLNYLKTSLSDLTEFAVFESNDERLWVSINSRISGFLSEFWRSGGMKGSRAADAFYVICNASNNTPASIDQGEVHIDVGVALQYPAEFVVINLAQWSGGSNAIDSL